MSEAIQLLVGLGNPGNEYAHTRHNAGAWLVEQLAKSLGISLKPGKFSGLQAKVDFHGHALHLLIPTTYMNRSGQAIGPLAHFYKLTPAQLLVAHDELDLPPGVARIKQGGGHGGHNGLRDTISALGNQKDFYRLRLGIGHPGQAREVSHYVLSRAPAAEAQAIHSAIDASLNSLKDLLDGRLAQAQNRLHAFKASSLID